MSMNIELMILEFILPKDIFLGMIKYSKFKFDTHSKEMEPATFRLTGWP